MTTFTLSVSGLVRFNEGRSFVSLVDKMTNDLTGWAIFALINSATYWEFDKQISHLNLVLLRFFVALGFFLLPLSTSDRTFHLLCSLLEWRVSDKLCRREYAWILAEPVLLHAISSLSGFFRCIFNNTDPRPLPRR